MQMQNRMNSPTNLVIRRRSLESFTIGSNVTVTILRCGRDEVVISVKAPAEIPVHRSEVAKRIEDSGRRLPVLVCEPMVA
jgi:carbon storage regulator CsrA